MQKRFLWQNNILVSSLVYIGVLALFITFKAIVTTDAISDKDASMKLIGVEKEFTPRKVNGIENDIDFYEGEKEFISTDIFSLQYVQDKDITAEKKRQAEERKKQEQIEQQQKAQAMASYRNTSSTAHYAGRFRLSIGNFDSDEEIIAKINKNFAGYPVAGTGETILAVAKKYNIDPYFIAAVTWEESGRGRYQAGKNNLHGRKSIFGGWMSFDSIEHCLWDFGDYITRNYINVGLTTIEKIQHKYCPNQGWANKIKRHMQVLIN